MIEEPRPTFFGPIKEYSVFQQLTLIFSRVGYLVFIKLLDRGWTGELRMPVLPEKGVEQEES